MSKNKDNYKSIFLNLLLTVRPRDSTQTQLPIYIPETPPLPSNSWTVEEIIQLAQQDQQEISSISLGLEETPVIDLPQYGDHEIDNLVTATIDLSTPPAAGVLRSTPASPGGSWSPLE